MSLSVAAEEMAMAYGKILKNQDWVTKDLFNKNFFQDWQNVGQS